jgi:hypothetical protein
MDAQAPGQVVATSRSRDHRFSKDGVDCITLLADLGVDGDCHAGASVKHRSRVARDPDQPNLRQVHLIHTELHNALVAQGFSIGARLRIGGSAIVEVTGLRNPCRQLNAFRPGLMEATLERTPDGALIRKAGVMGVVLASGVVRPGDIIVVEAPDGPHRPLAPV